MLASATRNSPKFQALVQLGFHPLPCSCGIAWRYWPVLLQDLHTGASFFLSLVWSRIVSRWQLEATPCSNQCHSDSRLGQRYSARKCRSKPLCFHWSCDFSACCWSRFRIASVFFDSIKHINYPFFVVCIDYNSILHREKPNICQVILHLGRIIW